LGIATAARDANSVPRPIAALADVSPIPLVFENNSGQAPPETKFIAHSGGGLILIRGDRLSLRFPPPRPIRNPHNNLGRAGAPPTLEIGLLGSRPDATVAGDGLLSGKVNYFIGSDPHRWIANIPTFRGVIVHGAWSGIDVSYMPANERNGSGVEMSFIVRSGADPSRIRLSLGGSGSKQLLKNGDVELRCGTHRIVFTAPHVIEEVGSEKSEVPSRFIAKSDVSQDRLEIDLQVARRKPSARLIVDPTLIYSTYLGGSGGVYNGGRITGDVIRALALDPAGNEYVAGAAASLDFPGANTAFMSTCTAGNGCYPAFVTKLDGKTGAIVYSTFLGGAGASGDSANAIAVDNAGYAYIAGLTHSNSFPTTPGVVIPACNGSCFGVPFATKLSQDGSSLVFSTLLSANDGLMDSANGIAVDEQNRVYVGGSLNGNAFATVLDAGATHSLYGVAIEGTLGNALAIIKEHLIVLGGQVQGGTGSQAAFLVVLDPSRGSTKASVRYARTFGRGTAADYVNAIAIDSKRRAWAVGVANESVATPKFGFHKHCGKASWCGAAFLLGLDIGPGGKASLGYSAQFGGNGLDAANAVAVDGAGTVYVGGQTSSTDFPVTSNAVQPSFTPCQGCKSSRGAAFVMAIKPGKARPIYSTYLGGADVIPPAPPPNYVPLGEYDATNALAVDNQGLLHAAGVTFASGFPITANASQAQCEACATFGSDGFVARINPAAASGTAALVYSSFLGGSGVHVNGDVATGVVMDASGAVYVAGASTSVDFPVTPGAASGVYAPTNAFVVKLNPAALPDQQLIYATYLGGSVANVATSLAVNPAGEAYVVGQTFSPDFPMTPDAFRSACTMCDAFFSKLDATGSKLLYSSAFASGIPRGVAIDPQGNALLAGGTSDRTFPITANALQHSCGPCGAGGFYTYGGFLSKIDPTASGNASLVYSSFLSGTGSSYPILSPNDWILAIASDPAGRAVLSGAVSSPDFAVTANALQAQNQGGIPAAVLSVVDTTAQGINQLVYSTYLNGPSGPGNATTTGNAVLADTAGRLYIGGFTSGNHLPTTPNSYSPSCPSGVLCGSGFVAVVDPSAPVSEQLVYGTYLGGKSNPSADDTITTLSVDSLGRIYAGGHTFSTTFPVTSDALEPSCLSCSVHKLQDSGSDGFLSILDPSASGVDQLVYSTYLGGSNFDGVNALALGPSGQVAIVGHSGSPDFPTTANALLRTCPACNNAGGQVNYPLGLYGPNIGSGDAFVSVFQF